MTGIVFKALGGFYYVRTSEGDMECRPVGVFRREGISPMVGDMVTVEATEDGRGSLTEISPRKNFLVRPPVANLDRLAMVVSCAEPPPNILILDKLTAIACHRGIPVTIIFSKIDLAAPDEFSDIYRRAGFEVFEVNSMTGEGIASVKKTLEHGLTAFCGNSGAGKSSLLNALFPELD
ncbi:MAG: GTPase RsgA, partial [Angelakisella sp.]